VRILGETVGLGQTSFTLHLGDAMSSHANAKRVRDEGIDAGSGGLKRRVEEAGGGSSSASDDDDEVGHIELAVGESIADMYRYIALGGKGTFGKVLLCEDRAVPVSAGQAARTVAVKVVRRIRKYSESALIEADILENIARADPTGASGAVRFYHRLNWKGHECMVFEPLGISLFDYVKANAYRPLPLYCVQSFADQLTRTIAFLHALRIVHTDLKLENVLLATTSRLAMASKMTSARDSRPVLAPATTEIKLIDFGGATHLPPNAPPHAGLINTRQYRSPEVILGMPWSFPSDVWSLGCILMEIYTGELLFPTVSVCVCVCVCLLYLHERMKKSF
jgi:serine/threonine protein kinase